MKRIIVTRTIEGYDDEVEAQTNAFLAKFTDKNAEFKALSISHGSGQRIVQTIVIEVDQE